jgi:hypothetical protein
MEIVTTIDRSLLALVSVRFTSLGDDHGTDLDIFMTNLNEFVKDVKEGNDVQISSSSGIMWVEETRLETDVEYDARLIAIREHQLAYQAKADSSWKRQQKKFELAHKNKKAN